MFCFYNVFHTICSFTTDVKIKSIMVIGGGEGRSPSKMRAYVPSPIPFKLSLGVSMHKLTSSYLLFHKLHDCLQSFMIYMSIRFDVIVS